MWNVARDGLHTAWEAIRARPTLFAGVALLVVLLQFLAPLAVLSIGRKPWDDFSFNRWHRQDLSWMTSPKISTVRKVQYLSTVALFWFGARRPPLTSNWMFFIAAQDLARWGTMAALFGAYFTLLVHARARFVGRTRGWWSGGWRDGFSGAILTALGLLTSQCTVRGYETPVLPVIGLAFNGLTGSTLTLLMVVSRTLVYALVVGVTLVVLVWGWIVSRG